MATAPPLCQLCRTPMVEIRDDALPQSGWTELPAKRYRCPGPTCARTESVIATGEPARLRIPTQPVEEDPWP